jgi:hypothetical protein
MKNRSLLSALERHCSVVSLLLIAGAGLIVFQGPVGSVYRHAPTLSRIGRDRGSQPSAGSQSEVTKPGSVRSTDNATSLSTPILGELPGAGGKASTSVVSK